MNIGGADPCVAVGFRIERSTENAILNQLIVAKKKPGS